MKASVHIQSGKYSRLTLYLTQDESRHVLQGALHPRAEIRGNAADGLSIRAVERGDGVAMTLRHGSLHFNLPADRYKVTYDKTAALEVELQLLRDERGPYLQTSRFPLKLIEFGLLKRLGHKPERLALPPPTIDVHAEPAPHPETPPAPAPVRPPPFVGLDNNEQPPQPPPSAFMPLKPEQYHPSARTSVRTSARSGNGGHHPKAAPVPQAKADKSAALARIVKLMQGMETLGGVNRNVAELKAAADLYNEIMARPGMSELIERSFDSDGQIELGLRKITVEKL